MTRAILIATLVITLATPAVAQSTTTQSFYGRHGAFAGSSATHGNTTSFSNRSGQFSGSAIRNSNGTTAFYDRNGHFTGSVVNPSLRSK